MSNKLVKLPKIADLTKEVGEAHKNDELNLLLNQNPPEKWVKAHPYIKGYQYLPIDKVELMLRRIFKQFSIEVVDQGNSFNGVWVVARVHYLHPVTHEWSFHDGIGAEALQTKSGESPADLANINNGALAMAYPIAKSRAVKNACAQFGKLFGSDLNREDTLQFTTDPHLAEKVRNKEMSDKELKSALEAVKEGNNDLAFLEQYYTLSDEQREQIKEAEKETNNAS